MRKEQSDQILKILKNNTREIEINKVEKDQEKIIYFYRVMFLNNVVIHTLIEEIDNKFSDIKFYFYENRFID